MSVSSACNSSWMERVSELKTRHRRIPHLEYHHEQQRTTCPVSSGTRRRRQFRGRDRRQCHCRQSSADGHRRNRWRSRGGQLEDHDVDAGRERQFRRRVTDAVFEFGQQFLDGRSVRDDQDLDLDVGRRNQDRLRAVPRRRRQLVVGSFTDTIVLDTTAPTVSAVVATGVTDGSATITWTTNEPATSQVEYRPDHVVRQPHRA